MNRGLPVLILIVTIGLVAVATLWPGSIGATTGIAAGSALAKRATTTPELALSSFLHAVQRRDWASAFNQLANPNESQRPEFVQELAGSDGSLRTYSTLEGWDFHPLHQTDDSAKFRASLRWSTAVGPVFDERDFDLQRQGDAWRVVWSPPNQPKTPAQVLPVNFLRWDVIAGSGQDWGSQNLDAPRVTILSMNAVQYLDKTVVMGEVVNQDTIPAFVNVNATLVDGNGNSIDEESSFDKIVHILLPKQVAPYRIDFPNIVLQRVKNVRMDVKATVVPAAADPVISVMDQKLTKSPQGGAVLEGQLLNQSGQTVNIPHIIASFYDKDSKVIWVSDGYVDQALLPQVPEKFAVEVPESIVAKVQNYHAVVNQYSFDRP
ncbi:MAG TPA: hypothetical protein VEG30_08145 [Terriglobales bacterium]|nr:hypothetical protein [Terriglobales bacterium]